MSSPAYIEDKPIRKVPREKPKPAAESRMPEVKESRDTEQPELSASEGVDECTEQGENQETSSQEEDLEWQSCSCFRDSCDSCRAERLAIMDPNPSTNKPRSHTDQYMSNSLCPSSNSSEKRKVWLFSSTNDTSAAIFTFHFHKSISDANFEGRECAASPSALTTLLFAKSFVTDPDDLTDSEASDKLYNYVLGSIEKAIAIHKDKFDSDPVTLTPGDACELLATLKEGDFNIVASEMCSSSQLIFRVVEYASQLQPSHALLVSCGFPYMALSFVNAREGRGILVFHSQHQSEMVWDYSGASLVYCEKTEQAIARVLMLLSGVTTFPKYENYNLAVVRV